MCSIMDCGAKQCLTNAVVSGCDKALQVLFLGKLELSLINGNNYSLQRTYRQAGCQTDKRIDKD